MTKLHFTSVPDLQAHQVVGLLELAQAEVQKSSGMNPKVVTWICEFADFFSVFWIGHIYIYTEDDMENCHESYVDWFYTHDIYAYDN